MNWTYKGVLHKTVDLDYKLNHNESFATKDSKNLYYYKNCLWQIVGGDDSKVAIQDIKNNKVYWTRLYRLKVVVAMFNSSSNKCKYLDINKNTK